MQYFYIVVYTIVGDDMTMCKIGLNPHQLIEWGRREATKHQDRTYRLYRQPITSTGTLMFYKYLEPYNPTPQHIESDFNWEVFETSRGSDMDIDIHR